MTRRLLIGLILAFSAIARTDAQSSWSTSDIAAAYGTRQLDPIEGVWKFPGEGATVMIIKSGIDRYDVKLLRAISVEIAPGSVIGTVYATAKRGYYDGAIDCRKLGLREKVKGNNIVINLTDDDVLMLDGYRTGVSVSFQRLLYRIFKVGVTERNERPKGLTGARRKFPLNEYRNLPICL